MAQVRTGSELRRLSFWQYGLYGWIFGTTGFVGLLLAAGGGYGGLSDSVSPRNPGNGGRRSPRARNPQIQRLLVGQGHALAAPGTLRGGVLAAPAMPAPR